MNNQTMTDGEDCFEKPQIESALKSESKIGIEEAMDIVGQSHKFQIYVSVIAFLNTLLTTYGQMVIPYFVDVPEFQCFIEGEWQICNESTGACDPNV